MRILNLGSLNMDRIYFVDHIVREGETVHSEEVRFCCGGKGLNQSVALAKAGMEVYHGGQIGKDGALLRNKLKDSGVRTDYVVQTAGESGHAVIQIDTHGKNSILVCAGANGLVCREFIDEVLGHFEEGDALLLQNEISNVDYAIRRAREKGMIIIVNPSPITKALSECGLENADILMLNESEAAALSGVQEDYHGMLKVLSLRYPNTMLVLTVGEQGAMCWNRGTLFNQCAFETPVIDTTAAGDTFCGYFIADILRGRPIAEAMEDAAIAAAMTVSRLGAADSIPTRDEVDRYREGALK